MGLVPLNYLNPELRSERQMNGGPPRLPWSLRPATTPIMPTSTVPYEILFDFVNDTAEPTTIRVLRQDSGVRTGAAMLLNSGENLSLVLTAGTPYKYALEQGRTEAILS